MSFVETRVGSPTGSSGFLSHGNPNLVWSIILLLSDRLDGVDKGLRFLDKKLESYFSRPRTEGKIEDYLIPPAASDWMRRMVVGSCRLNPTEEATISSATNLPNVNPVSFNATAQPEANLGSQTTAMEYLIQALPERLRSKRKETVGGQPHRQHHRDASGVPETKRPKYGNESYLAKHLFGKQPSTSACNVAPTPPPAHTHNAPTPPPAHTHNAPPFAPPGSRSHHGAPRRFSPSPTSPTDRVTPPPHSHTRPFSPSATDRSTPPPPPFPTHAAFPARSKLVSLLNIPKVVNTKVSSAEDARPFTYPVNFSKSNNRTQKKSALPPNRPPRNDGVKERDDNYENNNNNNNKNDDGDGEEGDDDKEWRPHARIRASPELTEGGGDEHSARFGSRRASLQAKAGIKKSVEAESKVENEEDDDDSSDVDDDGDDDDDDGDDELVRDNKADEDQEKKVFGRVTGSDGQTIEGYRVRAKRANAAATTNSTTTTTTTMEAPLTGDQQRRRLEERTQQNQERPQQNQERPKVEHERRRNVSGGRNLRVKQREETKNVRVKDLREEMKEKRRQLKVQLQPNEVEIKLLHQQREHQKQLQQRNRALESKLKLWQDQVDQEVKLREEEEQQQKQPQQEREHQHLDPLVESDERKNRVESAMYPDSVGDEREPKNSYAIKLEFTDSLSREMFDQPPANDVQFEAEDVKPNVDELQQASDEFQESNVPPISENLSKDTAWAANFLCDSDEILPNGLSYSFVRNFFICKICDFIFSDIDCLKSHMVSECNFVQIC